MHQQSKPIEILIYDQSILAIANGCIAPEVDQLIVRNIHTIPEF